jgi:hypothetical protein
MMLVERPDYPSRVEWAAWILKCAIRPIDLWMLADNFILLFIHRIFSVNYSVVGVVSVEETDSSAEGEGDHRVAERPKISSIVCTSPSKISIRARPPSLHLHEMPFARSVMARVERKVLSGRAATAVGGASRSLCVKWAL